MAFSTTIKNVYHKQKLLDLKECGFFYEYKNPTARHWNRINRLDLPCKAVFLVGRKCFRYLLIEKKIVSVSDVPEEYRLKDFTSHVWRLKLKKINVIQKKLTEFHHNR